MRTFPEDDREDVRLAVVMNGGVSLAVWIGGVVREMHRLASSSKERRARWAERDRESLAVYRELLDLVHATVRIDVIAGTSAGGINGALLAFATAHDVSLGGLVGTWAHQASLTDLLRSPTDSDTRSLLQGDKVFLPALHGAFRDLWDQKLDEPNAPDVDPDHAPVELLLTTSPLTPIITRFEDGFGGTVVDLNYEGRFRFTRSPADMFADTRIVDKLALASRCTASFPIAFEPVRVPIGTDGPDALHPDLQHVANFTSTRWVVDGGVLVNKPIRQALDAIWRQVADRQVRRVLAYVVPDPTPPLVHDQRSEPTAPAVALDTLVRLPRTESVSRDLRDIREHNARVRNRRRLRAELLGGLPDAVFRALDEGSEAPLVQALYPSYRLVRRHRVCEFVAALVTTAQGAMATNGTRWPAEEIEAALLDFTRVHEHDGTIPFVPSNDCVTAALRDETGEFMELGDHDSRPHGSSGDRPAQAWHLGRASR